MLRPRGHGRDSSEEERGTGRLSSSDFLKSFAVKRPVLFQGFRLAEKTLHVLPVELVKATVMAVVAAAAVIIVVTVTGTGIPLNAEADAV